MKENREDIFNRNLELWSRAYPKEAVLMPYAESEELSFCKTESGEQNIRMKIGKEEEYLHRQEGAEKEAKEWFEALKLSDEQVLYVYGVGLGFYYDAAKEWLYKDPIRGLVFLEDDLSIIKKFFETERASLFLQDPQVHLGYFSTPEKKSELLGELYWNFAMSKIKISALNYYKKNKTQEYQEIYHEILFIFDLKKSLLDEYLRYGAPYFSNYYPNLLNLPSSYFGNHFFGKFPKIPAIICGAGPSLNKNITLLRQLQNRALIFAGGSAINVLNNAGVQPHFCAAIDPNSTQQIRLKTNQAFEVPFFYRNRLNHTAFEMIHGPRLYLTGGGGYDAAKYFEEQLNIEGTEFQEGYNVVTFSLEIAKQMGCGPIFFVGMDLAFTDRALYSSGVTLDPVTEAHGIQEYFSETGLLKEDIFGNPVYTLWKWVAESEYIGEWIKNHPDLLLLNCTEGGLGFPGIENKTLADAANIYLHEEFDLRNRIHAEIQNSQMPHVTEMKVEKVINTLKESLERCIENFDILISESELLKEKIAKDHSTEPTMQSGKAALAEMDLADEPAYGSIVEIFNVVYMKFINSEWQEIKYTKTVEEDWERNLLHVELNKKKLLFLQDVCKVNSQLIDHAFQLKQKKQENSKTDIVDVESMTIKAVLKGPIELATTQNDSIREGASKIYYEEGPLKGITHYKNGKLDGESLFYAIDGTLLAKSTFMQGKPEGESFWHYLSGALYSIQRFHEGLLHGLQQYYYENGQLKTQLEYENGQLINFAVFYHPNGSLKRKIEFLLNTIN